MGVKNYLLFYTLCGIAGGVFYALLPNDPYRPMVGASGSVSGLIAAYVILFRRSRLTMMIGIFQIKPSAMWFVGLWFLVNMIGSYTGEGGVAWVAHTGGFMGGAIVIFFIYRTILESNPLLKLLNNKEIIT